MLGAAGTALATAATLLLSGAVLAGATAPAAPGAGGVAVVAVLAVVALWPAYATRPRRTSQRLRDATVGAVLTVGALGLAGGLGLAVVPAPEHLLVTGAVLVVAVPALAAAVDRTLDPRRIVVAGDDGDKIGDALAALDDAPVGYLSPPTLRLGGSESVAQLRADGGFAPSNGDGADEVDQSQNAEDSLSADGDGTAQTTVAEAAREESPTRTSAPAAADRRNLGALAGTDRVAGLTRFADLLEAEDVDTVVLGFSQSDRQEFFGALRVCRAAGVDAKVHESHAAATLLDGGQRVGRDSDVTRGRDGDGTRGRSTDEEPGGTQVAAEDVPSEEPGSDEVGATEVAVHREPDSGERRLYDARLDPLPFHTRVLKRAFDVCFAAAALLVLTPAILLVAAAITLDTPGPVLYGQERTGRLGRTFTIYKFRSMVADAEDETGPRLSDEDAGDVDPRVTRVGRVLRATHFDEVPQLVSILRGDMSVVGPRPERPEIDAAIADQGLHWERRWFLKPGLTGLAQINDVTGVEPARKLAHDLEYARRQSFLLDVRIVLVQIGMVLSDAIDLLLGRGSE